MLNLGFAAGVLLGLGVQTAPPPSPPPAIPDPTAVAVDDVIVEGRRLEDAAREFVAQVGAPAGPRGLARWNRQICVGVVNMKGAAAQYMVDRVSNLAAEMDIPTGQPGCTPNVTIFATTDGAALASAMVEGRRREFDVGSTQMAQGDRALSAFKNSDRAVRWWQISVPTDINTGTRAIRLAGDVDEVTGEPIAPVISRTATAGRLRTQIRDDMARVVIIFDVNRLQGATFEQLADYIAMVALAQVDPDADLTGYNTVLNLFQEPQATPGLTGWDRTYLKALYAAQQAEINPRAQAADIANLVTRERREARSGDE